MMCSYPGAGLTKVRSVTGRGGLNGGQLGVTGFEEWLADDCAILAVEDLDLDVLALPMSCRYDDAKRGGGEQCR